MRLDKIVAATDFSEDSLLAVETAFNLNLEPGAAVYLLHVLDVPSGVDPMGAVGPSVSELQEEAEERLAELVPQNLDDAIDVQTAIVRGAPAKAIAEFARDKEADLIVVATHGRTGLARLVLGSTAESLLHQAPCQVLVTKHRR